MKNPKILLIALGGVTALVALVLLYLIWSGMSDRQEATEALEVATGNAERLNRLPVRPCPAAERAVLSNAEVYDTWRTNALAAISAGDRSFESKTPLGLTTFIGNEARRLSALPGAVNGKLVKADFTFGFKNYITDGALPAAKDVPRIQREWSDISTVVELLATNGVDEVLDVIVAAPAEPAAKNAKNAKKAKTAKKGKSSVRNPVEEFKPDVSRFTVVFLARPEAFVGALNSFAASRRYIVVDGFTFERERDVLAEELGGEAKTGASAAPAAGRAGRRARVRATTTDEKALKKTGVVIDPLTAPPLKVTMRFAVYDFRTAAVRPEEVSK